MNKNYAKIIIIFAAVSGIIILFFNFSLLNLWQEKLFDKFFIKKAVSNEVLILSIDNESILKIGQWPWSRRIFAQALSKLQSAKTVAVDVSFSEPSTNDPSGDFLFADAINNSKSKVILPLQINQKTREITEPLGIFKKNSILGSVQILNDDGTARKVKNIDNGFSSFGAVTALQYKENLSIPKVMRIDYSGPQNTFLTLPIADFLSGKIPENIYKDKIVLIGVTAPDLHDFFLTPFGLLSGVEINANIINTLLRQKFYKDFPEFFSILLILLCNLGAVWVIFRVKKIYRLIFSLLFLLALINIAGILLFSLKIIMPVLYVNLGFLLTSAALIIFQYFTESEAKKFIYNSFKYYLSEEVINEIMLSPEKLKLGGEKKKITVFFSDIRKFTAMSEALTPEILTYVISEYMTEMTDTIMAQKGLVAQYFGDGIMAFWGAPLPNENQAQDACMSAMKMMDAVEKLNSRLKKESINAEINIGIGINTGEAIAGNIGSKKKFNYTVFGDGVNLTSRLEGLNKEYGTNIIISESTKKEIEKNRQFKVRELDKILVKGKKEPKTIFELVVKDIPSDVLTHFEHGRKYYQEGNWDKAIEEFSFSKNTDGPSKAYLQRCKDFKKNPPQNWNGVYEFKTK